VKTIFYTDFDFEISTFMSSKKKGGKRHVKSTEETMFYL